MVRLINWDFQNVCGAQKTKKAQATGLITVSYLLITCGSTDC